MSNEISARIQTVGKLRSDGRTGFALAARRRPHRRAGLPHHPHRQLAATNPDFVAVQTVYDSDATLADLLTGATIKVRITAANDAGESRPGDFVEMIVPQ